MLTNAIPANAAGLPLITEGMAVIATPSDLATWAVSIGRTVADVATLLFVAPLPPNLQPVFEDHIRQEVAAELLPMDLTDDEADQIETIAWLAFRRRIRAHAVTFRRKPTEWAPGLRSPG